MKSNEEENSLSFRPKRREEIEIIPVYLDVVLFDPITESGISLNESARKIWDLADGTRLIEDIVSEIGGELGITADPEALMILDSDVRTVLDEFLTHNVIKMLKADQFFRSHDDFPSFTPSGFQVFDLPEAALALIREMYDDVLEIGPEEEDWGNNEKCEDIQSELFSLEAVAEKRDFLFPVLQSLHEEWSGQELDPSMIYGIRSYLKGANLFQHKDRVESHHISSIIMVDKNLSSESGDANDWALNIQAHDGTWHEIFLQPGQALLYESCRCSHGRNDTFQGKYYRNFYVHFKLRHWEHVQ